MHRGDRDNRDDDLKSAFSLDELVALCTDTVEVAEVVCRVGRTDITDGADEEISISADAPLVGVYLVVAADRVDWIELIANSVFHVVVEDTDTFAQNVIVDLVERAHDCLRYGH